MRHPIKKTKSIMGRLCLVDKLLMLFMLVLFSYTVFNILASPDGSNAVDIIVRTSAAGIFGYFMSGNFLTGTTDTPGTPNDAEQSTTDTNAKAYLTTSDPLSGNSAINQIGFTASKNTSDAKSGDASFWADMSEPEKKSGRTQIITVSVIGLFSLVILIVARHYPDPSSELTAIMSQLRDFVSASIGFLISSGKNKAG